MLLIGMISFTAMATTPLTDENQTFEVVKAPAMEITMAQPVVFMDFEIQNHTIDFLFIESQPTMNDLDLVATAFYITDVGWRSKNEVEHRIKSNETMFKRPLNQHKKQKIPNREC
jgi:hypothetical protein